MSSLLLYRPGLDHHAIVFWTCWGRNLVTADKRVMELVQAAGDRRLHEGFERGPQLSQLVLVQIR